MSDHDGPACPVCNQLTAQAFDTFASAAARQRALVEIARAVSKAYLTGGWFSIHAALAQVGISEQAENIFKALDEANAALAAYLAADGTFPEPE